MQYHPYKLKSNRPPRIYGYQNMYFMSLKNSGLPKYRVSKRTLGLPKFWISKKFQISKKSGSKNNLQKVSLSSSLSVPDNPILS